MGSLQISTRSALGKVVHAVGLWPLTSLTHRKSACPCMQLRLRRLTQYIVKTKAAFQKRGSMEPMEPPLDPPLVSILQE